MSILDMPSLLVTILVVAFRRNPTKHPRPIVHGSDRRRLQGSSKQNQRRKSKAAGSFSDGSSAFQNSSDVRVDRHPACTNKFARCECKL